jgi:L-lactate dehydrogenase (cytochrome)
MFANRAEVAAARAAEHAGVSFVESTVSICSLEEVAAATKRAPWFQLYVMRDRGYAENLMARAQAVGCRVLVLTADLAVVGARYRDTRNGLGGRVSPVGAAIRGLDRVSHPRWVWEVGIQGKPHTFGNLTDAVPGGNSPDDFRDWVDAQFDPSVTWDDLAWVRDHWDGPVVLKGILDPEDARAAADAGVDAVVVSNHGGRQLDAVPSTAAALPAVVEAVGDRIEVLVDGGVRSGLDPAQDDGDGGQGLPGRSPVGLGGRRKRRGGGGTPAGDPSGRIGGGNGAHRYHRRGRPRPGLPAAIAGVDGFSGQVLAAPTVGWTSCGLWSTLP